MATPPYQSLQISVDKPAAICDIDHVNETGRNVPATKVKGKQMANDTITVAGHTVTVPSPYEEGHTLSANEASALNQVLHENIRNNCAKRVKDLTDAAEVQSLIDEYANSYQFGVRTGGGGIRGDAVMTEAMSIAREAVRKGLQKAGYALTGDKKVPAAKISELAKEALSKHPEWMDLARARVDEQKQAIASIDLSQIAA